MKFRSTVSILFFATVLVACTTYHSAGLTGGFSETQLGPRIYQVRFHGNGATTNNRAAQSVLRRAAELTLENNFRYFTLSAQQNHGGYSSGFLVPNQSTTVKFLENEAEDSNAMDAVMAMKSTDAMAEGRMSPKAAAALKRLQ